LNICRKSKVRVNLTTLKHNAEEMKRFLPEGKKLYAVVKADAYGHGIIESSKAFLSGGADGLCVVWVEEGVQIRQAGIDAPILVLAPINKEGFMVCAKENLIASIHSIETLKYAQEAANAYDKLDVHVALNTGLNRDGLSDATEVSEALAFFKEHQNVVLKGVYSHFACADNGDEEFSLRQIDLFNELTKPFPQDIMRHMAASAATLLYPSAIFDGVRCGMTLYGYQAFDKGLNLKPALEVIAEIGFIRNIKPGDGVGYGATFVAKSPMRIATLSMGFSDGLSRKLSNTGRVIIDGKYCPIVGIICMDQIMVDISKAPDAKVGDEAYVLGKCGDATITAEELAELSGSITYETLVRFAGRLPHFYIGGED
jgi:alanine racemase